MGTGWWGAGPLIQGAPQMPLDKEDVYSDVAGTTRGSLSFPQIFLSNYLQQSCFIALSSFKWDFNAMFQRSCSSSSHYTCIPTTQERGQETTAPTNVRPLMDRMCSQDPNLPKEGWRLNFYFGHFFFFWSIKFQGCHRRRRRTGS